MRDFDLVSRYKCQRVLEASRNAIVECELTTVLLAPLKRGDWNVFCQLLPFIYYQLHCVTRGYRRRKFRLADCAVIGFHPVQRNLSSARVLLRGEIGD